MSEPSVEKQVAPVATVGAPETAAGEAAGGDPGAGLLALPGLAVAPPQEPGRHHTVRRAPTARIAEQTSPVTRLRHAETVIRRAKKPAPPPAADPDLAFPEDGVQHTIEKQARSKQPDPEVPTNPEFMERMGVDIDEIKPVGQRGLPRKKAMARAVDVNIREFKDVATNRMSKHLGIEKRPPRTVPLEPTVSVVDKPSAVFDRKFGEVVELREIFQEALNRTRRPPGIDPVVLKNRINAKVRSIIRNGKSPAAQKVRDALKKLNYDERLRPLIRPKAEIEAEAAHMNQLGKAKLPKGDPAPVAEPVGTPTPVAEPVGTPTPVVEPGAVAPATAATGGAVAAAESGAMSTLARVGKGAAKVLGAAETVAAVAGSLMGGWELGSGIEELIEHHLGDGAIDATEGAANLGLGIGVPIASKAGLIASEVGTAAGATGLAAGAAAAGSVALAGETARAALHGEQTPIDVADQYYGSHLGDLSKYTDAAADALGVRGKYEEASDAVHNWYRKTFL